MSSIIPFTSGAALPAYLKNAKAIASAINKDVARGASYPSLSIKGKVFTLVKDSEKKPLTRVDEDGEHVAVQSISLAVLRANTKSRVYYAKSYVEGDSDGARPTCSSADGIAPLPNSEKPQAKKCALCPHAVWGSKVKDDGTPGEGTECSVNTRLAVADPDKLDQPLLLRVPAGSRKNFADAVKVAESRGIPYNALVLKVAFDMAAPSPKLTFRPTGLLDDAGYAKATALYESELVREIVALAAPADEGDSTPAAEDDGGADLDAALAAKAATAKAAARPATRPAPTPAPAPVSEDELDAAINAQAPAPAPAPAPRAAAKPKPTPAPAPVVDSGMDNLLGDLDALLGAKDD